MLRRNDIDKCANSGTSENSTNHECFNSEITNLTDDEDFDDASAFHSTKVIPVRNRNIDRANVSVINTSNYKVINDHEEMMSISDDNEKMDTTDDDNSFSPPALAKSLNQQTIKPSSIMNAIVPRKLFKLTSGVGVINPNISKLNAIDDISNKKFLNSASSVVDNSCQSDSMSGTSVINVNAGTSKSLPKRYFRWGLDNQSNGPKSSGQYDNKPIENDMAKRNSCHKNLDDDDDDKSEILDGVSCNSSELSNGEEKIARPIVTITHKLMIAGVNVEFPLKPYPSQIAVMNALIRGCTKEEHALVESPTGSGKTLALLCGALAWQKQYAEKNAAVYEEWRKQQNNSARRDVKEQQDTHDEPMVDDKLGIEGLKQVPKIYYGSRTHRQISQVVKELSRTTYAGARMTILSSRDFTCIQNTNRNKTELCNELLDPIKKLGCPYYNEDSRRIISSYNALSRLSFPDVWDIEDIVKLGQRFDSCPYYAARNLMLEADIIFCPYNYLIDPSIRRSMQIDLKGDVIILDEAHNIEDICRDAASISFKIAELNEVITDCVNFKKAHEGSSAPYFASVISVFCERLINFIEITGLMKKDSKSDQMTSKFWTGAQFVEMLRINQLDVSTDSKYKKAATDSIDHHHKAKEDMRNQSIGTPTFIPSLSSATIRILENIIFSIDMITSSKHASDYRIFIKEMPERFTKRNPNKTWESRKFNDRIRELELLCMNPGVVFTPLADAARTIALASGTLAPTASFSSELQTKFPNMLHANHVISREQVFVRAISQGPMKIPLRATYANVNSWKFQDELGRVLLDVCETVPYGVLCFFSSYTSMNNLTDRWKQNGIMSKIEKCKYVMEEPRINSDLAEVMVDYRQKIRECPVKLSDNDITGVILFAVFRGKVAEGIDFSDNEARCVLTIGIPYAVMNDPAVELKIAFNDSNCKERNTLKGREWYTVQAYRALNQALGRCIRHKNDWGAILLVDDRFLSRNNQSYLPNWIKSMWSNRSGEYNLRTELKQFVMERKKVDADRITGTM